MPSIRRRKAPSVVALVSVVSAGAIITLLTDRGMIFRPRPSSLSSSCSPSSSTSSKLFVQAMSTTNTGGSSSPDTCGGDASAGASAGGGTRGAHRILCYGDSLTAGTSPGSGGYLDHPYAPHLQAKLREALPSKFGNAVVRHRGLPGWTASSMVDDLDGPTTGLRSAIRAVKDPPLSLVILMAGSNDIGYGFDAATITRNIKRLHEVAWESGVPRTVAIGIPPSGYQSVNGGARDLANEINSNLERICRSESDGKATFVPFPFQFESGGGNWDPDTLHFSPKGYQVLGESLVPVVERVLDGL